MAAAAGHWSFGRSSGVRHAHPPRDRRPASPAARDRGLTARGSGATSLSRFGANRLTPLPREPLWKKFLDKFDEPIIKILLAAPCSRWSSTCSSRSCSAWPGSRLVVARGRSSSRSLLKLSALAAGARCSAVAVVLVGAEPAHPAPVVRGAGRHGRRHPGHRAWRSSASTRATASSRRSTPRRSRSGSRSCATARSTPSRWKRWWSATWSSWRWATRSRPTAGSSGRPSCSSTSR